MTSLDPRWARIDKTLKSKISMGATVLEEGVSRWRQIARVLIEEITGGGWQAGKRLPASTDLASRFGVNRHTVLRALGHLQAEGYVRMERGRGSYAVVNPLQYRLGPQRWFEQNLIHANRVPSRRVVTVASVPASGAIASALRIEPGADTAFITLLGEADGIPINFVVNHFVLERLPGIDEAFRAYGTGPTGELSFSRILKSFGVTDFRRTAVRIRSRPPTAEETRHLQMAPSDHVLETDVTLVDPSGTPLVYANTAYCSSRVEFVLDL